MKQGNLYKYEIVKRTLEINQDRFLRKEEIAELCGLHISQVSRIIKAAWRLGWVSRLETSKKNDNAFGQGKYPALRTAYKIKRTDSWMGLMPLYHQVIEEWKETEKETY